MTSREEWLEEAPGDQYDVLYFLCHGGQDKTGDSMIILGKLGSPGIRRKDLNAYQVRFTRHRPLVVLNACETAALEPDKVITLIEGFTYYGASAVIGTEITVFNSLAYEFGTTFLDSFVIGQCHLGEAVRRARLTSSANGTPWVWRTWPTDWQTSAWHRDWRSALGAGGGFASGRGAGRGARRRARAPAAGIDGRRLPVPAVSREWPRTRKISASVRWSPIWRKIACACW